MFIVKLKNISKTYGNNGVRVEALKDVSFNIKKGEFVIITGESGSGKSTLLNIIGGLDNPTKGTVIINDKNIFQLSEEELTVFRRKNIGFVFQSFNLIPELNVQQNILLPILLDHKKIDQTFLDELLHSLNLEERAIHLPSQLSGGQQQRVAIGRALVTKPSIVLADEPTGNLDSNNSNDVIKLLKLMSDKYQQTTLMITHNNKYRDIADRVFKISDGILTELGEN